MPSAPLPDFYLILALPPSAQEQQILERINERLLNSSPGTPFGDEEITILHTAQKIFSSSDYRRAYDRGELTAEMLESAHQENPTAESSQPQDGNLIDAFSSSFERVFKEICSEKEIPGRVRDTLLVHFHSLLSLRGVGGLESPIKAVSLAIQLSTEAISLFEKANGPSRYSELILEGLKERYSGLVEGDSWEKLRPARSSQVRTDDPHRRPAVAKGKARARVALSIITVALVAGFGLLAVPAALDSEISGQGALITESPGVDTAATAASSNTRVLPWAWGENPYITLDSLYPGVCFNPGPQSYGVLADCAKARFSVFAVGSFETSTYPDTAELRAETARSCDPLTPSRGVDVEYYGFWYPNEKEWELGERYLVCVTENAASSAQTEREAAVSAYSANLLDPTDIRVGICFDKGKEMSLLPADCSSAEFKVLAVGSLSDGDYPSAWSVEQQSGGICAAAAPADVNIGYWYWYPSQDGWDDGFRYLFCAVELSGGHS